MMKEDLEIQFKAAKLELNEACQKACSLDKELEDQNKFNEKLNSTCNFLHLQQERIERSLHLQKSWSRVKRLF
ncbi:hypothetical protein P3S67_007739 [Capsicum chacoense]